MKLIIAILLAFISINISAQYSLSQELKFIQHLINQEEYEDAIYYINSHFDNEYSLPISDSLHYFKGWSQYSVKNLNLSASSLLQVSSNSTFFVKSRFFAAYNYSHLGQIKFSDYILQRLNTNRYLTNLKNFELTGNALLARDTKKFKNYFKSIESSSDFSFNVEKEKLNSYDFEIDNHRNKSMFVGGLMSAIIPGAGKIYAGKTGEGISTFLIVAATGATAYENHRKLGLKHAKTILFGSLFAVLYIGNIYGTVFTVKLANEEFNHEMDNKILFNMHIPLRNLFN
ncbi:MAG: hypothetical protein HQ541_13910 [Mariniphaga sp.]|nr:hypothetical protein [Mariniphaga sp.]